jgi:hypothetical protein
MNAQRYKQQPDRRRKRREASGRRSGGAARLCSFADLVYLFQFHLTSGCWTPGQQCSLWFDTDQIKSISAYSGTSYIRFTTILVVFSWAKEHIK